MDIRVLDCIPSFLCAECVSWRVKVAGLPSLRLAYPCACGAHLSMGWHGESVNAEDFPVYPSKRQGAVVVVVVVVACFRCVLVIPVLVAICSRVLRFFMKAAGVTVGVRTPVVNKAPNDIYRGGITVIEVPGCEVACCGTLQWRYALDFFSRLRRAPSRATVPDDDGSPSTKTNGDDGLCVSQDLFYLGAIVGQWAGMSIRQLFRG